MNTQSKQYIALAIIILLSFSCNNFRGLKLEEAFEDVSNLRVDTTILSKYISPNKSFSLSIPLNWDIQEDSTDNIQGVFFMDNLSFYDSYENFKSIAITKHLLYKNLKATFKKELSLIKKDSEERIIRIGKEEINSSHTYWMLTESNYQENSFYNLTYFITEKNNAHIILLKASVYKTITYQSSLSELNKYIHTFSLYF